MTLSRRPRSRAEWIVVIPTRGAGGKTRLSPLLGPRRPLLARALALDTLAAARRTPGVRLVVVTDDPVVAMRSRRWKAAVVPDPGTGLTGAIGIGVAVAEHLAMAMAGQPRGRRKVLLRAARSSHSRAQHGRQRLPAVAILLGDLPAVQPRDLRAALAACAVDRAAFVPDAQSTGTVLLAAPSARQLRPAFGPGSAQAHAGSAVRRELPLPRLRADVDTPADLAAAMALGVGRHTRAALATRVD